MSTMYLRIVLVSLLLSTLALPGIPAAAPTAAPSRPTDNSVQIDFQDVDITVFIKFISELTGTNYVVDRAVQGKVTVLSPSPVSPAEATALLESVLEVHGYTTVAAGATTKIVPAVLGRAKGVGVDVGRAEAGDHLVTRIIPLRHAAPEELRKILAPLVAKSGVIASHPASGSLLVTDSRSNIARLLEIVATMDVPAVYEELALFPLRHAAAIDLARELEELFGRAADKGEAGGGLRIVPHERANSLVVRGSKSQLDRLRGLLTSMDIEVPRDEGRVHVHYLKHANAGDLVKVLLEVPDKPGEGAGGDKGKGASGMAGAAAGKNSLFSDQVRILADNETNAVIVIAPRDEYALLRQLIEKLDIPRRMVYIEALIMEVKAERAFEVGVQWVGLGAYDNDSGIAYGSFSGSANSPFDAITGLQGDSPSFPAGFSLGVLHSIKIGDVLFPDLASILKAYRNDEDINIIATPQILTTDNKKAEIRVGENVPYIVSKNTSQADQDYTSYDYKDVSTSLEITPQISQNDVLRLDILTEVVKLKNPAAESQTPTTLKRTAKTTVLVRNEDTVVIGGIIGQDSSQGEYKVPLLGDIPVLGWLFKGRSEAESRTNLFIFITPRIVENPAQLAKISSEKRRKMEELKPKLAENFPREPIGEAAQAEALRLVEQGFARMQGEDFDGAGQFFLEALKLTPDNPYALLNLGVIRERQGKTEEAIRLYRRVLTLNGPELAERASEPGAAGKRLVDIARENLARLGQAP
ncbi:MAG: type II secretion system protein GspD [Desulfobulbaceae bacterium A2]|nr:MAG: type II secretion system protein GspD [Desulfobulbaceae bacterium A2]